MTGDLSLTLQAFTKDRKFSRKGPLSVALVVTEHARNMGLPLDPADRIPAPRAARLTLATKPYGPGAGCYEHALRCTWAAMHEPVCGSQLKMGRAAAFAASTPAGLRHLMLKSWSFRAVYVFYARPRALASFRSPSRMRLRR
jgi:hypothetical protein